jgi:hypothetical protein
VSPLFRRRQRDASGVIRHTDETDSAPAEADSELIEAIEAHVARHFGPGDKVFHQIESRWVHVDIHITEPRPWRTLVTSGMSTRPMSDGRYAELMLSLPADWPLPGSPELDTRDGYWPYWLLQELAVLPHRFHTTLDRGDTVPNSDPPKPYAPDTGLCGALVFPPVLVRNDLPPLTVGEREVEFLALYPLYADEMDLKLEHGLEALLDRLYDAGVTDELEPGRPSVVGR